MSVRLACGFKGILVGLLVLIATIYASGEILGGIGLEMCKRLSYARPIVDYIDYYCYD